MGIENMGDAVDSLTYRQARLFKAAFMKTARFTAASETSADNHIRAATEQYYVENCLLEALDPETPNRSVGLVPESGEEWAIRTALKQATTGDTDAIMVLFKKYQETPAVL